jgi:hypothetical protein
MLAILDYRHCTSFDMAFTLITKNGLIQSIYQSNGIKLFIAGASE